MNRRRAGFSLFEVLVAFAILSLVLTALIPGQARLLGRAANADQQSLAFDYIQSRAAALGVLEPLQLGSAVERYRDWIVAQITTLVTVTEQGQVVETQLSVTQASGQPLASLKILGFIPNAP